MLSPTTQAQVQIFLTATDNLNCPQDVFEAAYQVLSDSIENFGEFEAVCMELGIA